MPKCFIIETFRKESTMQQIIILITTMLISITLSMSAQARKPAVEDIFTVESSDYKIVPKGQEVAVNFTNTSATNVAIMGQLNNNQSQISPWFAFLGFFALVSLPALMWFQITQNHPSLEKVDKKDQNTLQTPVAADSNIAKIEDYRKETKKEELNIDVEVEKETHKKAS